MLLLQHFGSTKHEIMVLYIGGLTAWEGEADDISDRKSVV